MEQKYVLTFKDHRGIDCHKMEIDHVELVNLAKNFPEIRAKVPASVDLKPTKKVALTPDPNAKLASHYRKTREPNSETPIRIRKKQGIRIHKYQEKGKVFVEILEHVIDTGKYPLECKSGHKSFCISQGLVTRDESKYVVTPAGYDKLDLWKNWSCSVIMRAVAKYLQEDKGWIFRIHLSDMLGCSKSAVGDAVNALYQAGCLDLQYGCVGCQSAELIRWKDGAVYNSRSTAHNVDYATESEGANV